MKLYIRLLLLVPFIFITSYYITSKDPDEVCQGLVHFSINAVFYILIFLTFIIAAMATFFRTNPKNAIVEPTSFSIMITFILMLIFHSQFRGHNNGEKWIYAENREMHLDTKTLLLRKNGNFTINLTSSDFGCSFSSSFIRKGDTIILNKETVDKTNQTVAYVYLLKSDRLTPLIDTINKIEFYIAEHK